MSSPELVKVHELHKSPVQYLMSYYLSIYIILQVSSHCSPGTLTVRNVNSSQKYEDQVEYYHFTQLFTRNRKIIK